MGIKEEIKKALKKIGNKKVSFKINDEFTVYPDAEQLLEEIKSGKDSVYFEDPPYDVKTDFKNTSNLGWYKRYGLLSFEKGKPALFRDGDNWKICRKELEEIPYHFHEVEDCNNGKGFYNLQKEVLTPEEEYDETFNCYYFEEIRTLEIKDFETGKILASFYKE